MSGGGIKKLFLLGSILLLLALLYMTDFGNYNREKSEQGFGLGLRKWELASSLRRLISDHRISTVELSALDSRAIENYVPYDAFFVAPNWTEFDVRRKKNTHWGLQKLNFTRANFPELQADFSAFHSIESVSNTTRDAAMLIYNRVPKSGSSTVRKVVAKLSKINGFATFQSDVQASHSMPTDKEREFTAYVAAPAPEGKSLVYDRHMYYIDVERYLQGENVTTFPNWFNFVRHPVSRFESEFYYLRSAKRWKRIKSRPKMEWFNLTLDRCMETNAIECDFIAEKVPYRELQLTFFCGNAPECRRIGSRDALAQVN